VLAALRPLLMLVVLGLLVLVALATNPAAAMRVRG
jgi:hypothetical protein